MTALELDRIAELSAASAGRVRSCGFPVLGKGVKGVQPQRTRESTEEYGEGHDFSFLRPNSSNVPAPPPRKSVAWGA